MAMYPTRYHRPADLDGAVQLFAACEDATYLAGGHTLLPTLKQRLASPSDLIDLCGLPGLAGISLQDGVVSIGATDAARRRRRIGRRARAHSCLVGARRIDRRSACAPSRHHRRVGCEQRSGGRLSGGRPRPRCDRRDGSPSHSPPTTILSLCTRRRSRRAKSSPGSSFPFPQQPVMPNSAALPRATPSRRSSYRSRKPVCGSR